MPSSNNNHGANNPHAAAAHAYGDHAQKTTSDQREIEARVLLKAARAFQDLQDKWDTRAPDALENALKTNRNIWMMFFDTALENPEGNRPNALRSNIINLANFIFKRELEILSDPAPEKLKVLININQEIAAGLLTAQKTENQASSSASTEIHKKA